MVDDQRCQGDQATGDAARLKFGKTALYEALATAPARHSHSDPRGFVGRQSSHRRSTIVTRCLTHLYYGVSTRDHTLCMSASLLPRKFQAGRRSRSDEDFVLVISARLRAINDARRCRYRRVPCNRVGKGRRPVIV